MGRSAKFSFDFYSDAKRYLKMWLSRDKYLSAKLKYRVSGMARTGAVLYVSGEYHSDRVGSPRPRTEETISEKVWSFSPLK